MGSYTVEYRNYSSQGQLLNQLRFAQFMFAQNYISQYTPKENDEQWKKYLLKQCMITTKRIPDSAHSLYIEDGASSYKIHLEFFRFLNDNILFVVNANSLFEIYKKFSSFSKKTVREIVTQFTANETSFQLNSLTDLLIANYSSMLGGRVLEVGAGSGSIYQKLKMILSETVLISDANTDLLIDVPEINRLQYDFNCSCAEKNFDLIISCRALHLALNKTNTINYLKHSLCKGGLLVFSSGNKLLAENLLHPFEMTYTFFHGFAEVEGFINRESWEQLLIDNGFEIRQCVLNCYEGLEYTWILVAEKK